MPPRRVLIVRLGAMGDIVHALPVLASMKRDWPGVEVDWIVDRRHRDLLDLIPDLTSRLAIDTRHVAGATGWFASLGALRARHYDLAIDAQGLLKSAVVARLSGASRVVGFSRGAAREGAAAWCYHLAVDPGTAHHIVERNLALVRAAGVETAVREFPLRVPGPTAALGEALGVLGDRFVILNPGAAWPNKRWPADRFAALAGTVRERFGLPALVAWGPGEQELAGTVVRGAVGAAVLAPPTTLHELVTLLARASLVVAGDTGPLHVAAALGRPVVGIFGPTDPRRNGPWSPDDLSVSRSERCVCPHKRRCHAAHWCLDDVSVEEVMEAVARRLGRPAGRGSS